MMEPFAPPGHGFVGRAYPTPGSLCGRGWPRPPSKGFSRINKLNEKIIYFYCPIAPPPSAMIAKTAFIAVGGLP